VLTVFFLLVFFSPSKIFYFSSFLILAGFLSYKLKNTVKGLTYALIVSLFLDVGIGYSYFKMEPDLGSLYAVKPATMLALGLVPLAILKTKMKFQKTDIAAVAFFIWLAISFFYLPYSNIFYGIIQIFEALLIYLLLRANLESDDIKNIKLLMIATIFFQLSVAYLQFILKRNAGFISEGSTYSNPFGLATYENENLFRVSGTFDHPNIFAAIIVSLFPFLALLKPNFWLLLFFGLPLFFSYSRLAWAAWGILLVIIYFRKMIKFRLKFPDKRKILYLLPVFPFIYLLFPYFISRSESLLNLFTPKSSLDIRLKMYSEGLNIIGKYPFTGVGLNNSLVYYASYPVTTLFSLVEVGFSYRLHNMFLEIAAETGLIGLGLFLLILVTVYFEFKKISRKKKQVGGKLNELINFKKTALLSLIFLLIISFFNPFFHNLPFQLLLLYISFIMVSPSS